MASLELQTTWNIPQILEEIEKTTHEISSIDQELDDLFSERVHLEQRVLNLSSLDKELNNVQLRSKEMAGKIHSASISGNEISKQVSELDCAQSRVEEVLSRVSLMLDLKQTIKNVEEYINASNYESYKAAAQQTYRILHQSQHTNIQQIDEVSFEILRDLEQRLVSLIKKQCENAQFENDMPNIINYASLYPYLGDTMKLQGLDIYCSTINKELRLNLEEQNLTLDSQAKGAIINYVAIIEGYIDMVFTTITQNETELKEKFAACLPIHKLVEILHNETDVALSKLLNHYLQSNEMDELVKKINAYSKMQHHQQAMAARASSSESVEKVIFEAMKQVSPIQVLDKILDEISHISQELMAYDTTMRALLTEQIEEEKSETDEQKAETVDDAELLYKLPTQSKISLIRTRLTGDYIILEQFNMQYQIYRVLIEENNIDGNAHHGHGNDDEESYRSGISGAIYYLLKTLAIRAFNTYDCNVSCAIVNHICNSLESIYKEWLDKKLKQQPGQRDKSNIAEHFYRSTKSLYDITKMGTSTNSQDHKKSIIILNTIDQSMKDNNLITNQLEEEVNQIFQDVSEKDKFKIRQTIKGFDDISKSFERIIDRGIYRYSQTFHQILQSSLNRFKEENYQITDKQFNNQSQANRNQSGSGDASQAVRGGDNRSFVDILIQSSKPTFYALSRRLTSGNFDRMLLCLLAFYLNELERFIFNHKFTFWGSLKFDKNRQELQSYFSELTNTRSIRDQFVRMRCIAEILQFSKIDEAVNYVNDEMNFISSNANAAATTDQTLTPDEIKKFLLLRTEFNAYEIEQLQL